MPDSIEVSVANDEATDYLLACLDEWQGMGNDNTELFDAMDRLIDDVKAAHRLATAH